jgi:GT2 family glycosyltransferase
MITIVYSTHKDKNYNNKFREHLLQSVGLKNVQILEYINYNQYSLSQVYNSGVTQSIYDIVVCCHNDIKLEKNWGKKLLDDFSKNPEFGIIGKAGSCYFPETGVYWEKMHQTMVGQVYHHPEGQKKWLSRYSVKLPNIIPVVTIDGLFISFDKTKIKHQFDETIGKFHFYDHLFCVPNYIDGVGVGVTSSFDITHESVGQPNQEFWDSREKFVQKWGSKLPLDLKPEKIFVPKIERKNFKRFKKVAIVIPTKNKLNLLFDCINSFLDYCDPNMFSIFIADTGSTDEEINKIETTYGHLNNVKLIKYDYYNFAKINNDVVKNHVGEEYEFILFSNNDIKILNDVISGMLSVFDKNKITGTVGARLHFANNTIQHNGVFISKNTKTNNTIGVSHVNLTNYYNYFTGVKEIFGNTGGLLMIRKNVFESLGYFNENYISCFEDVELNIMCLSRGLKNYNNGDCVAYHYESQTRNEDPENLKKLSFDYHNNLIKCVESNIDKIKKYIILT